MERVILRMQGDAYVTTDHYYTVAEIAKTLGVTPPAVYKWIRSGKLEAYQFGDAYRITTEAFERFKAASKVKPDSTDDC